MDAIYTVRRFLVVDWYGEQNTEIDQNEVNENEENNANHQQFEMKRTLVRWVNRIILLSNVEYFPPFQVPKFMF